MQLYSNIYARRIPANIQKAPIIYINNNRNVTVTDKQHHYKDMSVKSNTCNGIIYLLRPEHPCSLNNPII